MFPKIKCLHSGGHGLLLLLARPAAGAGRDAHGPVPAGDRRRRPHHLVGRHRRRLQGPGHVVAPRTVQDLRRRRYLRGFVLILLW